MRGGSRQLRACYDIGDNSIFSYCPDNPGDGTVMTINFTAGEMKASAKISSLSTMVQMPLAPYSRPWI